VSIEEFTDRRPAREGEQQQHPHPDWVDAPRRRKERLLIEFWGGLSAYCASHDELPEPPLSLATCEKVPMSLAEPDSADDTESEPLVSEDGLPRELFEEERDVLQTAYRHGVGGASIEELAEAVVQSVDASEALHQALGRSEERQANVVALLREGEVPHALRLASCGQRSVQLECPHPDDHFGADGCGYEENYVPISCDSRLCPDCGSRRQGQAMERYGDVVGEWSAPTAIRLSLPRRIEATEGAIASAVDELRDAFGKLRRRVIQPSGEFDGKRWVWEDDGGRPADHYWKQALKAEASRRARENGDRSLFGDIARWEREYVEEGRGIPIDELFRAGVYGVDAKQGEDGSVNVHMHVLADVSFIPQAALSEVWGDLTGAPVVDVRRVEEGDGRSRDTALMETVGYAAKPPEYETLDAAVSYAKALKGSKLIQPFGELHGNTPDVEADLLCGRCERTPSWWEYRGTVDERLDTMGTTWESPSAGDGPPDTATVEALRE